MAAHVKSQMKTLDFIEATFACMLGKKEDIFQMLKRPPSIYIMTNKRNVTLYTGVTRDLIKRVHPHKTAEIEGFARKYGCKNLVYYEQHETMLAAIEREKQIKAGSRKKKLALIESLNPEWVDLYQARL